MSEQWTTLDVPAHETMKAGQKAAKKIDGGVWKWAASPGDGKRNSVFQCNLHIKCPRQVRVHNSDGVFILQVRCEHGSEDNEWRRANSALKIDEERVVRVAVDSGGKPAAILSAMTKESMKELREQGEDPLSDKHKKPTGGLICARRIILVSP